MPGPPATRHLRERVFVLLLYVAVTTALAHVDTHIYSFRDQGYTKLAPAVLNGTESAPARYRVLAPFTFDAIRRVTGLADRGAWTVFRWLTLFGALLAAHWYFTTWFARGPAVAGVLAMAALFPLTMTNGSPIPDHTMELFLFTLGCACIARGADLAFAAVLLLNAFNRETSVFLLPLYLLARPIARRRLLHTAALAAAWVAIYAGLRWWRGLQLYNPWQVRQNIGFLFDNQFGSNWDWYYRHYPWFGLVIAVPLAWAAAAGRSRLPRFVRMSAFVVAPLFFVTAFLFSSIIETRMLTPLLPLLLPAALFLLFAPEGRVTNA